MKIHDCVEQKLLILDQENVLFIDDSFRNPGSIMVGWNQLLVIGLVVLIVLFFDKYFYIKNYEADFIHGRQILIEMSRNW